MPRKAKPTKHSSAELSAKAKAAQVNKGGGKAGLKDRLGGAAGHAKFACAHCGTSCPSLKSMQIHHEAKHSTIPWDPSVHEDLHAKFGGTTKGVGVRGTTNHQKLKTKGLTSKSRKVDDNWEVPVRGAAAKKK